MNRLSLSLTPRLDSRAYMRDKAWARQMGRRGTEPDTLAVRWGVEWEDTRGARAVYLDQWREDAQAHAREWIHGRYGWPSV